MKPEKKEIDRRRYSSEYALEHLDELPVAHLRDKIREEIRRHSNFVLIGETGSGKTSCLPPLLLELRNERKLKGKIAVTQPRRLAATSITERVSSMMQTEVGDQVGYHIRFDDTTSKETDIVFMTDGILLRKISYDPLLTEYSIVMIDEAHEQTNNIILCLGLLMEVNEMRLEEGMEPIKIIVTSATIERNRFANYIGNGDKENSIFIEGKMFPVEVFYLDRASDDYDFTEGAAETVKMIIENKLDGDILIFMPGKGEIAETIELINAKVNTRNLEIIPLHAEMSPSDQEKIFTPSAKRKVVVATNIAETSITPKGKINVIDTGLIKQIYFDPHTGIERLMLVKHAISGLDQRLGRAGRTDPGRCFRLFTRDSLKGRPQFQTSELLRSDLSSVILTMKKAGVRDVLNFNFLDNPERFHLIQAIETITALGGLDDDGELTEIGDWLIDLALEPHLGRMVIEALRPELNCVNEVVIISSFLDGKNVFIRSQDRDEARLADMAHAQFKGNSDSDFTVYLNIWNAYRANKFNPEWAKENFLNDKALEEARNVRQELIDVLRSHGVNIDPNQKVVINRDAIHKAIAAGRMDNLMILEKGKLRKVDRTKDEIYFHPSSSFYRSSPKSGSYIIAGEIFTNPQGKTSASNCLEVKHEWLKELAPNVFYGSRSKRKGDGKQRGHSKRDSRRKSHHRR